MFNLILLTVFVLIVASAFYRVACKERTETISEKRRKNRIALQQYANTIEIKNYMKTKYNIDYDVNTEKSN